MKKTKIIRIPYMKADEAEQEYLYIATQKLLEIEGEEHLFVEIFDNTENGRKTPKLRMVFTKNDWCLYYQKEGLWSSATFRDEIGYEVWDEKKKGDEATYMSEDDQDVIWNWCGENGVNRRRYTAWQERLESLVRDIRHQRRDKRRNNREKNLKERIENTPPLPEDLKEWADRRLFQNKHFLYYKRHGRYADICCSSCGKVTTAAVKRTDSFGGQFEKVIDPPQNNLLGRCPSCKALGTWKAKGRTKGAYGMSRKFFIGMPYKGEGAVIRYLECEKVFRLDEELTEKDTEMTGAGERYIITEIARKYFEKNKKRPKTDYHKYSPYYGNFWDDCNLDGMQNINTERGAIYGKTWDMLKGTILQYSGAEHYQKEHKEFNLMDYMERYIQYPQIEMLSKAGLYGVVESMVRGGCGIIMDRHASRPDEFLGIRKDRMKFLIREKGDTGILDILQAERRMNADWKEPEIKAAKDVGLKQTDLTMVMDYMSLRQFLNRLEKYTGVELGEDGLCGHAVQRVRTAAGTYLDYLCMRLQRGYDMTNTVFLWPKDLKAAHDKMVEEINKDKIEKRETEAEVRFPEIRRNYRNLRNRYYYEDDYLLIRPARSAAEIVREGRTLHHCVGGNNYLSKHARGASTILFIRKKELPDEPYITVEIKGTEILQWYGEKDRKTDKGIIEKWLKNYINILTEQIMIAV